MSSKTNLGSRAGSCLEPIDVYELQRAEAAESFGEGAAFFGRNRKFPVPSVSQFL